MSVSSGESEDFGDVCGFVKFVRWAIVKAEEGNGGRGFESLWGGSHGRSNGSVTVMERIGAGDMVLYPTSRR